ncbi:MAG TPA: TonB-dependent receptor, partial [Candidatus Angelobacter sp.]|nr:TonB-dependent receptor [Candidatus Angelobacter sp.]
MHAVRWLTFLLLMLIASFALAQTNVDGQVKNAAGSPVAGAQVSLAHANMATAIQTARTDQEGKFHFAAVEGGQYVIKTEAPGFFPGHYEFVLRPREPVSLAIQLSSRTAFQESIEVRAESPTIDPAKTGSSQTFSHEQLERLPDPMTESANALVANLMPGASQSHDNFINVRGNEFSLHQFINGVSFLENTQPQFGPGISPQIFETVDLMTGGFTPEYGNRFGGVLDITTRSGRTMQGHGSLNFLGLTQDNYDLNAEYGGAAGKLGYYAFADGFTSGRFLDPPNAIELNAFGSGLRGTTQLDWA